MRNEETYLGILTLLALLLAPGGRCTQAQQQIPVIDTTAGKSGLRWITVGEMGDVSVGPTIPLSDFGSVHPSREGSSHWRDYVRVADVRISPNRVYMAALFEGGSPDDRRNPILRIYDLRAGRRLVEIRCEHPDAFFLWCAWIDGETVQYDEYGYRSKGRSDHHRIVNYSVATRHASVERELDGSPYDCPDPLGHRKRAIHAASVLERLDIREPPSPSVAGPYRPNTLGLFTSSLFGAVSDDGEDIVGASFDKARGMYYVVVSQGKRVGELSWPPEEHISNMTFAGRLLVVALTVGEKRSVEVWSIKPAKRLASVPAGLLVHWDKSASR